MKRLIAGAFLILVLAAPALLAQGAASAKAPAKKPPAKDPVKSAVGGRTKLPPGEMITTEIFADEAFFDSAKHIGVFTGHVIVNDPRFNVQSDKLTIYLAKEAKPAEQEEGEVPAAPESGIGGQGLEKAVAEGNVGVVRDRPGENGGPPERSVGRADMAIYTANDGKVELRGTPRMQNGLNTHIATSPDTVMVIDQTGQLVTKGPSRTEIRQEPKTSPTPAPAPTKP